MNYNLSRETWRHRQQCMAILQEHFNNNQLNSLHKEDTISLTFQLPT